jgi:hydrogenase maturation factor
MSSCDVDRTSSLATTGARDRDLGCITCGDVGIAMRVLSLDAHTGLAVCREPEGGSEEVDVGLVEPVAVGDAVLVHAGVALVRLEGEGATA